MGDWDEVEVKVKISNKADTGSSAWGRAALATDLTCGEECDVYIFDGRFLLRSKGCQLAYGTTLPVMFNRAVLLF